MRIALLSGADKNAGDFLIVNRSKQLLEHFIDGCEIVEFPRNRSLDDKLGEINSCDAIVFAGGPGYVPDMYPGRFPLVDDIARITPPFFALGMGGYTPTSNIEGIRFKPSSRILLDKIEGDGFKLGCRDNLTKRLLNSNGYNSALTTGCPAWYDLNNSEVDHLIVAPSRSAIRSIAISDPAALSNINAPKYLVKQLREVFPNAEIKLVFHRGWSDDRFTSVEMAEVQSRLVKWALENNVEPVDISYSCEGFAVYNACDLHVGYRVHAHLYNISQRKPSYLIEEDGRGYGANDALGISTHIAAGTQGATKQLIAKLVRKSKLKLDLYGASLQQSASQMARHVVNEVNNGYPESSNACKTACMTFPCMKKHIQSLKCILKN